MAGNNYAHNVRKQGFGRVKDFTLSLGQDFDDARTEVILTQACRVWNFQSTGKLTSSGCRFLDEHKPATAFFDADTFDIALH